MKTLSIAKLKKGQKAVIKSFTNKTLSSKLIEMGCLPGTEVILTHHAPFGDPIAIKVSGYTLSMRREEAATILINHK